MVPTLEAAHEMSGCNEGVEGGGYRSSEYLVAFTCTLRTETSRRNNANQRRVTPAAARLLVKSMEWLGMV